VITHDGKLLFAYAADEEFSQGLTAEERATIRAETVVMLSPL